MSRKKAHPGENSIYLARSRSFRTTPYGRVFRYGPRYILGIVDKGSYWTEVFPAGSRTPQTTNVYLSQIFARFGIPKTLVSENGPELVSGDLKQLCQSLGIKKIESPIYHPIANRRAQQMVQTAIWAFHAWSPNLNVSFGAIPQWALMTHRNTSKMRGKTPVELMLRRTARLPAVTDFDLCEAVFFKSTSTSSTVPATFTIQKAMNASFIKSENLK